MTHATHAPLKPLERLGPSIVEEIREIREQIDKESGHDLHQLAEHVRRVADEFRQHHRVSGTAPANNDVS